MSDPHNPAGASGTAAPPDLSLPEEARSPLASQRPALFGAGSIYAAAGVAPEDVEVFNVMQHQGENRRDGFAYLIVRDGKLRILALRWPPDAAVQAATCIGEVFRNMSEGDKSRHVRDMTAPTWRAVKMRNEPIDPAEAAALYQQEQADLQLRRSEVARRRLEEAAAAEARAVERGGNAPSSARPGEPRAGFTPRAHGLLRRIVLAALRKLEGDFRERLRRCPPPHRRGVLHEVDPPGDGAAHAERHGAPFRQAGERVDGRC